MDNFVDIPNPSRFLMGNLFKENEFTVPVYQRNYAWQSDQVDDFWNDLKDVVDGQRNNHFFGQIVTYRHDNILDIIDGQQRLTTSSIFLAVLRDTAKRLRNEYKGEITEDADDTLRDIRKEADKYIRGNNGERGSLTLQQGDTESDAQLQEYFYKTIHGNLGQGEAKTEPMRNIQAAYDQFTRLVRNELSTQAIVLDRIDLLNRIFTTFVERFYVVMITAPTQRDAFIIFETLNSRGSDLKVSDIIKNHLMYLLEDDLGFANRKWTAISDQLKANSDRITRFIRTYWAARKHLYPESSLYRNLSQELQKEADAREFLEDLEQLVKVYDVMENPLQPKVNRDFFRDNELKRLIDTLDRMGVVLYHPILLAMYKRSFSEQDMAIVLNKVLSIFVRHRTIINEGTNKLESGFADVAGKIFAGVLPSVDQINGELTTRLMPSDINVLTNFQVLSKDGGQRRAKKWTLMYLLSELFSAVTGEEVSYEKAFLEDAFEIVRISEDGSVDEEHMSRIGNWTIVEKTLRYDDANSVDERIKLLARSGLKMNNIIAEEYEKEGWGNTQVDGKQAEYGTQVTAIWA
jgi:uncharacterized protein with ParB-like and HNH nuclease domain